MEGCCKAGGGAEGALDAVHAAVAPHGVPHGVAVGQAHGAAVGIVHFVAAAHLLQLLFEEPDGGRLAVGEHLAVRALAGLTQQVQPAAAVVGTGV